MRKVLVMVAAVVVMSSFAVAGGTASADFVCPVFNADAVGAHNPNAVKIGGGDYTIIPNGAPHLEVPDHPTNCDCDGNPGFRLRCRC